MYKQRVAKVFMIWWFGLALERPNSFTKIHKVKCVGDEKRSNFTWSTDSSVIFLLIFFLTQCRQQSTDELKYRYVGRWYCAFTYTTNRCMCKYIKTLGKFRDSLHLPSLIHGPASLAAATAAAAAAAAELIKAPDCKNSGNTNSNH